MRLAVLVLSTALAGCATVGPVLDSSNSAELAFARESNPKGFPGGFEQMDSKRIGGSPNVIRVPAGKHTIIYSCPDVFSMDYRPEIRASFSAGHSYLLECGANLPGTLRER